MIRYLLAIFAVSLPLTLWADAPKPKQGPYVVMVGVTNFDDTSIKPRATADADAEALYKLLTDPQYLGVPKERAALLTTNGSLKPTREHIIKAIHEAVAKTGKDDLIILGFFGRGASSGDGTAFFAMDSTVKDRAKNAVLGSDLAAELKPARGQKILFLSDVNYSVKGFDPGKETLIEPTLRDVLGAVFGTNAEDRDEEQQVHDKLVALATIPSNEPLIRDGHGLFAASVLEALEGKGDREGYASDGTITADELVKYLENDTANAVRAAGKTTKEKESVPFVVGGATSHFPITKNPAVTAKVAKQVEAIASLAKDDKLAKEVAEEGTALINRMPKLKTLQELRKEYEKLADGKSTLEDFTAARTKLKDSMILSAEDAEEFMKKTWKGFETLKSRYIKVLNTGEMTANAIHGMYRQLELTVPANLEEQLKDAKDLSVDKQKELLVQARLHLGKREDLDGVKDTDLTLTAMTMALNDPYTIYLDKETVKKAESSMRSQFSGIGIHIRRDLANDALLCVAPIKGSPAYKAGLKAGDLIIEIRREVDAEGKEIKNDTEKVISTKGMKMDDALKLILGKPGVPVTVVIQRDGKILEPITINRGRVSLETVLGTKRDENDDWQYWIDEEDKIAYVYLTQFGPQTYKELRNTVEKCKKAGMKGLILDLRANPGGMLSAALMISDMFVESGKLVTVRPRVGRNETYEDEGFGSYTNFPMAVLINGQSASASEIVSACLQDHKRATVIGERSYGKGSVQTIQDFDPTQGQFKFTTARYFPPSDRNIDKLSTPGKPEDEWGVMPDKGFEVKLSREEKADLNEFLYNKELLKKPEKKEGKAPFKDTQLEKALEQVKKEISGVAGAKP